MTTDKLRICCVVEPGVDGVFRHVSDLISAIRYSNESELVGFIYSDIRGSPELVKLVDNLADAGIPCLNLRVSNAPAASDLLALFLMWRFLTKVAAGRPLICHAHSSKAGALTRAQSFLGFRNVKIYTPHSYFGIGKKSGLSKVIFDAIEAFFAIGGASVCVSNSERGYASRILGVRWGEIKVIFNGVDTERFRPGVVGEKRSARMRFGLPEDAIVIGAVGRYSPQKDPHSFYAAVARLCAENPKIWVLHCGGGPEYDVLTPWILSLPNAHRFVRIRHVSDTSEAYRAMDLFVLASRYEGFALSAVEAMASGLPMVLTRCSGNVDIGDTVADQVHWCRVGDVADIARAMSACVDSLPERTCNHRAVAENHFSKKREIRQYFSLYAACAAVYEGRVV